MGGFGTISTPVSFPISSSPTKSTACNSQSRPRINFPEKISRNPVTVVALALAPLRNNTTHHIHIFSLSSTFPPFSLQRSHFSPRTSSSSSVGSTEYKEEATTKVKFSTSLSLPGCSTPLSLLGTGFREKVFAIIGVKVYAAGLYVNQSIFKALDAWKGRSAAEIQEDSSLFKSIFQAPVEKSLDIVLVRDIDGKTFWDALDEALSPRIKSPTPVDEIALSTFRSIFQGQSLKKGTFIFLTWLGPTKMLVSVSSDGIPSSVDATIESKHVPLALFDVFFGSEPVSPSLKASISNGLATALK